MSTHDSRDIGLAPHLQFAMSEQMHDYVYTASEKARDCDLYRHKPVSASTTSVIVEESGASMPTAAGMAAKSQQMRQALEAYEKDAKYRSMRETRAELPIAPFREEICGTIAGNEVTILVATTGSGACTQSVLRIPN